MTAARFIPRAHSPIVTDAQAPIDQTWYRYLRSLGLDLDGAQADIVTVAGNLATHEATIPPHGIVEVADVALVTGSNTVAHGLGRTPVGWAVVADDALPVYVSAYANAVQNVTGTATIQLNAELADWRGNFNTSTYTFTAPHAGLYLADAALNFDSVAADVYVYGALVCSALGTRSFGETSGRGDAIRFASCMILLLAKDETVYMQGMVESGTEGTGKDSDDVRLVIRSDESLTIGAADATNLTVYSARSRTASFWVW